jgi:Fe-S-cluster-containing dehydrogenase component
MLDAGHPIELRRGDVLHREGDACAHVYFLAEGVVQLAADNSRVLAYHKAGDFFGDEALAAEARRTTATATSDAWIFAVRGDIVRDLAAQHPDALARAVRVQTAARAKQDGIRMNATRHVLDDLHRFETARSLLAIDQERCLRCGHCAWSCAEVHDDGVSRLLRRGDIVVAKMAGHARSLLLPSSCQHCKNPACMIDCPTGAITRDKSGEVHIREELCTGCGSCVRACPWDNVRMAPRGPRHLPIVRTDSPSVAVKCDLCHDRHQGPACVAACPTAAIVRLDPSVELDDVRAVLAGDARVPAPQETRNTASTITLPAMIAAATLAAFGTFELIADASRTTSGLVLLALIALLFGYAAVKRFGLRSRGPLATALSVRPHFVFHIACGVLTAGVAAAHARGHSGLAIVFWSATFLGAAAGLVGWLAPRRLARIERTALLPEELRDRLREIDARVFRDLSGKSDLLKGLYTRLIGPFSRSPTALAAMCAGGTPQRTMRGRLAARIHTIVGARDDERLAGLDGLITLAVERQALRAQRVLTTMLRATSFAHVVAAGGLAVLVVLHVIAELGR